MAELLSFGILISMSLFAPILILPLTRMLFTRVLVFGLRVFMANLTYLKGELLETLLPLHILTFSILRFAWVISTRARLDWGFANNSWTSSYRWSIVSHLTIFTSDHSCIWFHFDILDPNADQWEGNKLFRFEAMWICIPDCESKIHESWGPSSSSLLEKIKILEWVSFGGEVTTSSRSRKRCQTWKQRPLDLDVTAKQHWHRDGDRNTAYFHAYASVQKKKNYISSLKDGQGVSKFKKPELKKIITDYFGDLYSTSDPLDSNIQHVVRRIRHKIPDSVIPMLSAEYTSDDVRKALKSMHLFQSPGPDGMSPVFYQNLVTAWTKCVY
ncbi:hypothetical protein OROMI_026347 [Orobanche minor]